MKFVSKAKPAESTCRRVRRQLGVLTKELSWQTLYIGLAVVIFRFLHVFFERTDLFIYVFTWIDRLLSSGTLLFDRPRVWQWHRLG